MSGRVLIVDAVTKEQQELTYMGKTQTSFTGVAYETDAGVPTLIKATSKFNYYLIGFPCRFPIHN